MKWQNSIRNVSQIMSKKHSNVAKLQYLNEDVDFQKLFEDNFNKYIKSQHPSGPLDDNLHLIITNRSVQHKRKWYEMSSLSKRIHQE